MQLSPQLSNLKRKDQKMIKIIHYIDTPEAGGAINQMFTLCNSLDSSKYSIEVIFGNYKALDPIALDFENINIPVSRINVKNPRDSQNYNQLKNILNIKKPNLLHFHLPHSGSCRYAYLAANKVNIPVVATEHDPFPLSVPKRIFKKLAIKWTAHTIAISNHNLNLLIKNYNYPKDKITLVHNGIDLSSYSNFVKDIHNKAVVTTIATLHPRKGIKYLIQAVPDILKNEPNVKFFIVGNGDELPNLKDLAKNLNIESNITFWGWVRDIKSILKTTDIYVQPSVREAFGLSVLEAMACKIPVVASSVGGLSEIIEDQTSGIFVPPENSKALSDTILRLLKDEETRKRIANNGNKRVTEHFSAQKMARETEKVYDKVLAKN